MATATLDELDQLAPRFETEEDGDFIVVKDVPVWKEHISPDGHKFGPDQLRRVANRCNDRIRETGDFSPVVIGHTKDDGSVDPPVVGFCGPYRMGKIGNKRPKAAILAHMRFYKEDFEKLKRYPRVSVEYWANEDDPYSGYFDPISLLGATTPELDLGLRYSHQAEGHRVIRYSREAGSFKYSATAAVCPGGSNSYVPGMVGDKKKKEPYQKEPNAMALSEEDLRQIVEAMGPVIRAAVSEELATRDGEEAEPESELQEEPTNELPPESPTEEPKAPERFEAAEEQPEDDAGKTTKSQYAKAIAERNEIKTKYEKLYRQHGELHAKHDAVQAKLDEIGKSERQATRYAKLVDAEREGITFDPAEEIKDCADMTDEQFDRHLERIKTKYSRVSLGNRIIHREKPQKKMPAGSELSDADRKRYAKQAEKLYKERGGEKKGANYTACLEEVRAQNGKPEAQAIG